MDVHTMVQRRRINGRLGPWRVVWDFTTVTLLTQSKGGESSSVGYQKIRRQGLQCEECCGYAPNLERLNARISNGSLAIRIYFFSVVCGIASLVEQGDNKVMVCELISIGTSGKLKHS